ncbi:MAG: aminodeoxychorismate synthase component I [Acidobacteriaceae bacterium]
MPPATSYRPGRTDLAASTPGSVLLERAPSGSRPGRSMLFSDPAFTIQVTHPSEVRRGLAALDDALAQGFYVAGYVAYEAGFALEPSLFDLATALPDGAPLVWFGCFRTPLVDDDHLMAAAPHPTVPLPIPLPTLSAKDYARKVEAIRELIAAGDTYQANLTTEVHWHTGERPAEMYERLLRAQPVPYAALLHPLPGWHVLSFSPELFFARGGSQIVTRPMKGTASPGMDLAETNANARWLQADEKNRAENVMIVDLLRNDLGRVCETGSIAVTNLFAVERYPTVLQMTSTVEGRLRDAVTYQELFGALFPSGSIVGAPKIHTMRLLHALEQRSRGIYTGAIGFISPDRNAEFNVAIRTVSLRDGQATLGVGSGIVYDSVPALEYEECRTKTLFLTRPPDPDFQLIETLLLEQGRFVLLTEHLDRMAQSAEFFNIPFDVARLQTALDEARTAWAHQKLTRVRLLLDRNGKPSWSASCCEATGDRPATLLLRAERIDPADRFLRHKTTCRALYDQTWRHAQSHNFADALFRNTREEITEGAIHNVIASIDGKWFTPALTSGVLPGIYRAHLIHEGRVSVRTLNLQELLQAQQIYICNSVRGLRRVAHIMEHDLSHDTFHPLWTEQPQAEAV